MFPLFYKFFSTIGKIFSGKNLWFHALAIVLTIILVTTGTDWWYYKHFHDSVWSATLWPAVRIGHWIPILLPLFLLLVGYLFNYFKIINTGWALGQAAFLGWLVSSFYKAFTGRPGPSFHYVAATDITRIFRFGFWRGGIFWGWPSSHTAVAFAMAFTLVFLFPKNKYVRYLAPLYALYIGIGVSMTIHWFSDFIAGAIFGCIIGSVIGNAFLKREESNSVL